MPTTEDILVQEIAVIKNQITDLKRQCDTLYSKLGMPSWEAHKRQAAENAKAAGTRVW